MLLTMTDDKKQLRVTTVVDIDIISVAKPIVAIVNIVDLNFVVLFIHL